MGNLYSNYIIMCLEKRNSKGTLTLINRNRKSLEKYKRDYRKIFNKYGIKEDELDKYFDYQIFRFRSVSFIPTISTLFNYKSIKKYLNVREYLDKVIYKQKNEKYYKDSERRGKNLEGRNDVNEREETDKKRYIKMNGNKELKFYCLMNSFYYNKSSKVCKKCKYKKICRKRKSLE